MSDDPWPSNPFAYSPISGPFMAFSSGGDSGSGEGESCPESGCGGGIGNGPLAGGLYDNGLPGPNMCSACGYDDVVPGGDCSVCGGSGTGMVK